MEGLLETPAEIEPTEIEAVETEVTEEAPETVVSEDMQVEGAPAAEVDSKLPLWKQAVPQLDKIKAENPALAAKIKDALITNDRWATAFPEGVKSALALRGEVTSLADALGDPNYAAGNPTQVLADVKSQLGYFHGLDAAYTAGSPEFVTKLAEASPEAFQKLMPAMFGEFSKQNPDGYSSYVAKAVDSYMESEGLSLEYAILREFLPLMPDFTGKARVEAAMEKIYAITQGVKDMAKKPVTAAAPKQDDAKTLETQRAELAQQQMDVTRQSWNSTATTFGTNLRDKEVARLAGKTAVSDEDRRKINAKVSDELDARLTANKGYGEAMRGFLQNKDAEGYKRRLHSEYQKLIPGAVSRAYSDVVTSKPKATAAVVRTPSTPGPKPADAGGFRPVSKYPSGQVDVNQTTRRMMDEGKYILKDGTKVQYKRGA